MPNTLHFNLAAGAQVTISVSATSFQPQLVLLKPDHTVYDALCGNPTPLTADTTDFSADDVELTADATESGSHQLVSTTFTVPVSGLWTAQIGSCDGGCGNYHFMLDCL